jgi:predicted MPP superfamily phosphohydrolase
MEEIPLIEPKSELPVSENIESMTNEDKFIHFGCWNNTNISIKKDKKKPVGCLKEVMNMLSGYLEKNKLDGKPPNFMVIAGDNYYPDKYKKSDETKVKIIYPDKLREGFDILPNNLPIHMILGNHDLETNGKKSSLFINDENTVERSDCAIINIEKEILQSKPNISYNLFEFKRLKNDTLLLMVDTSMYSDDVNKFLPCYNIFLGRTFETSEELMDYQNSNIYEAITNFGHINNIIIIGHHPIIGLKFKDFDEKKQFPAHIELLNDIIKFNEVLKKIYELAGGNSVEYYYLCADLHMYQKGKIELEIGDAIMKINQYIVGTGGTKLDDMIPDSMDIPTRPGIRYIMEEVSYDCGFLECKIEEEGLIFTPILLNRQNFGGKKIRKTRKARKARKGNKTKKGKKTKKARKARKGNKTRK